MNKFNEVFTPSKLKGLTPISLTPVQIEKGKELEKLLNEQQDSLEEKSKAPNLPIAQRYADGSWYGICEKCELNNVYSFYSCGCKSFIRPLLSLDGAKVCKSCKEKEYFCVSCGKGDSLVKEKGEKWIPISFSEHWAHHYNLAVCTECEKTWKKDFWKNFNKSSSKEMLFKLAPPKKCECGDWYWDICSGKFVIKHYWGVSLLQYNNDWVDNNTNLEKELSSFIFRFSQPREKKKEDEGNIENEFESVFPEEQQQINDKNNDGSILQQQPRYKWSWQ